MVIRSHLKGDAPTTLVRSDCERSRHALGGIRDDTGKRALRVMLNPSSARKAHQKKRR
ncbi:MAG: hypothetical protein ACFCUO_01580 [Rhodospirillales bacterium]